MATVSKEVLIEANAEDVWAVVGDFATGPSRMAPGFVVDTRVEADHRVVTFADGTVVRERLISIDHDTRRIAYSVVGGSVQPDHDNASMRVVAEGEGRCRLVWLRDVLPDALAAPMGAAMAQGLDVTRRAFDDTREPRSGSRG